MVKSLQVGIVAFLISTFLLITDYVVQCCCSRKQPKRTSVEKNLTKLFVVCRYLLNHLSPSLALKKTNNFLGNKANKSIPLKKKNLLCLNVMKKLSFSTADSLPKDRHVLLPN